MRMWLHRMLCRVIGHEWSYYFYGDHRFLGQPRRRWCPNCLTDEPVPATMHDDRAAIHAGVQYGLNAVLPRAADKK